MKVVEKNGIKYCVFEKLEKYNIPHLFTTKIGGVSKGYYSTMNVGITSTDDFNNVIENHKRVANILNTDYTNIVRVFQNHTNNVKIVDKSYCGKGLIKKREDEEIDALITTEKEVVLALSFADCVPVFLYDYEKNIISVIHSGWRGTAKQIVACTIKKMIEEYNSNVKNIICCIGPSICKKCFEVSKNVYDEFEKVYSDYELSEIFEKKEGNNKYFLDMIKAIKIDLKKIGVLDENIECANLCTYEEKDLFFSHRLSGLKRGHMGAFIKLNK